MKTKKAQVWVETVIYTLIGLSIIGIILGVISPKISEIKDRGTIEQTITALNTLDEAISWAQQVDGRSKTVTFKIKKGVLEIKENNVVYVLENLRKPYSEVDAKIHSGKITIKTEKFGSRYKTILSMDYNEVLFTFEGKEQLKTLTETSLPYKIAIENTGESDNNVMIDISII